MPDVLIREPGIPIQFAIELEKTDEEKWFFKGIASSDDIDLVGDIVTEEALEASVDDLLKNSTIFLNHNKKRPIGRTVATEFIPGKGLVVTGMISKTEPEIWRKIQEGVLNKLSIGAIVLNAERTIDEKTGQPVVKITRMLLKEHSLVSLPANPEARNVSWWVKKSLEEEDQVEAGQEFQPWPGGDELSEANNALKGQEEKDMSFPDEDLKNIGKRIAMIRDQRHWEVKQLADKTGLSEEDVQAIESGEKKDLDEKLLQRIATELHVRFEDIARKNLGDGFWTEGETEGGKPEMAPKSDEDPKPETEPKKEDPYKVEMKSIDDLDKEASEEAQKDAEKEADKRKQDARMKQIKFLLSKLKGGPNEGVSGIAKQLEALIERALGVEDPYPYPAAYPYPRKELDEFMGKVLGEIEGLKTALTVKPEEKPVVKEEPEAPKTPAKEEGGRENIRVLKKSEGDRKDADPALSVEKKDIQTVLNSDNPLRGLIEAERLLVHVKT